MSIFDCFPRSNAYQINIDWLIKSMRELENYVKNYTALNTVAYAGIWDITKQYPQWALVSANNSSYLSLRPVPVGVPIENTEYWQLLADLDPRISGIIEQIADLDQQISGIIEQIAILEKKYPSILDLRSLDNPNLLDYYNENFEGVIFMPENCTIEETIIIKKPVSFIGPCTCHCTPQKVFDIESDNTVFSRLNIQYEGIVTDPETAPTTNCAFSVLAPEIKNCLVEYCSVTDLPGAAVSINSSNVTVFNCEFSDLKTSMTAAVWIGPSATNTQVDGCYIHDCYLDAIHIEGAYTVIQNCRLVHNGLRPAVATKAIGACGIYGGRTESDYPKHLTIINNEIKDNSEAGIDLGIRYGTIQNNKIFDNALNGILIAENFVNNISGNKIMNNGTYTDTLEDANRLCGIYAPNSFSTCILTDNYIKCRTNTAPSIYTDNSKGNNTVISQNIFENTADPVIRTDSSIIVANNVDV